MSVGACNKEFLSFIFSESRWYIVYKTDRFFGRFYKVKMERVQRSFTKHVEGLKDKNYRERLRILKIYSIERRRERFILIMMFKILHGIAPNPGIQFTTNHSERTGVKAVIPQIKSNTKAYFKNIRIHSFGYVGPKLFN